MIREKYIVYKDGRAIDIRPNTVKSNRKTALKRIEKENEPVSVQKNRLK